MKPATPRPAPRFGPPHIPLTAEQEARYAAYPKKGEVDPAYVRLVLHGLALTLQEMGRDELARRAREAS